MLPEAPCRHAVKSVSQAIQAPRATLGMIEPDRIQREHCLSILMPCRRSASSLRPEGSEDCGSRNAQVAGE